MNEAQVKELLQKNFTLKGRIFYPMLLSPAQKTNRDGGTREQYSCAFAWEKGSNQGVLQEINQTLMNIKNSLFPNVPMQFFINPIKDYDSYQRQDGRANPEFWRGCYWLNAQSGGEFPPQIVDQQLNPIMDASLVYSGANAAVNISFYKIDNEKKGFGVNINAVMLTGGGDPAGGGQSVNVNEAFGSFANDMNMGGQPPMNNGQGNFNQNAQQNMGGQPPMNGGGYAGNGQYPNQGAHVGQNGQQAPNQGQYTQQNMGGQYAPNASPSNGGQGGYDPNNQQPGQWNPMQGQNNNNGGHQGGGNSFM